MTNINLFKKAYFGHGSKCLESEVVWKPADYRGWRLTGDNCTHPEAAEGQEVGKVYKVSILPSSWLLLLKIQQPPVIATPVVHPECTYVSLWFTLLIQTTTEGTGYNPCDLSPSHKDVLKWFQGL